MPKIKKIKKTNKTKKSKPIKRRKRINKNKQKGGNTNPIIENKKMCSPTNAYESSCFTTDALRKIIRAYNTKTNSNIGKIKLTQNKKDLVKDLSNKFCKDYDTIDFCILNDDRWQGSEEIKTLIRKFFKPPSPKGKYDWLSSIDIADVMDQYEEKYPDFIFLGPVPIDFDEILTEVGQINLKTLVKEKKRIGIVFNTDPHDMPGEHWISMFIDLNDKTICFFDSTGDEPPQQITDLINKLVEQCKDIKVLSPITIINKKQHQFSGSECGIYSLFFIIQRLSGKSCNSIFNNIIKDEAMNANRKILFSNPKHKNIIDAFQN